MDWKSLTQKTKGLIDKAKPILAKTKTVIDTAKPILAKAKPIAEKARDIGSNTVAFVGKQIEQTPAFLKTEEEYNIFLAAKRSIFIAYDAREEVGESIRLLFPVWATQAWTDAADIKYLEISANQDLATTLNVTGPLEMRIAYMGEEYGRMYSLDEIKAWWKDRCYIRDEESSASISLDGANTTPDATANTKNLPDPIGEAIKKPRVPRKKKTPEAEVQK